MAGAVDTDPIDDQPAADAFGPLITAFDEQVVISAHEVDGEGRPTTPSGVTFTIGIVVRTSYQPSSRPPAATATEQLRYERWDRGPLVTGRTAGELLIQAELPSVVRFQVVVTALSAPVAGTFLAIHVLRGPR